MKKVTYTLDDQTVEKIRQAATRAGRPQSSVVREAVASYTASGDAPTPAEIRERLRILDAIAATPPTRAVTAVDAELRQVRESRRAGWRRRAGRRA